MNPLYLMLSGMDQPQQMPQQQMMPQQMSGMQFANPMQKANYIMQAMTNPAAFVRQAIPNLPPQIANDPNQILMWMQQNGMVTQQQIQEAINQMPRF